MRVAFRGIRSYKCYMVLALNPLQCLDAQHRHQQRTAQVRGDDGHAPGVLAAREQGDGFSGEGGEGSQPAEKAGDDEQASFGRQPRMLHEKGDGKPDEVTANQIGGQRAQRQLWQRRVEPQAQAPA